MDQIKPSPSAGRKAATGELAQGTGIAQAINGQGQIASPARVMCGCVGVVQRVVFVRRR